MAFWWTQGLTQSLLNDLRMSIVKYFSMASIKSEFGNKRKVEF